LPLLLGHDRCRTSVPSGSVASVLLGGSGTIHRRREWFAMTRIFVFVAASLLLCACCPRQISPEMAVYGPQSDLILKGTVRVLHTSTVDAPDADSLGVVRVDAVIKTPAGLAGIEGRDITVKFKEIRANYVGQELILFTSITVFGDEIAVVELGSRPPVGEHATVAELERDAVKARAIGHERMLQEQVLRADAILVGMVSGTRPVDRRRAEPRDSEHDPMWTVAVVQVEEGLKGVDTDTLHFVFAASNDVAWFRSPKPQKGDRGVFLLRRDELRNDRLTLLDSNGFQVDKESIVKVREFTTRSDHD
jgi:hypothetical protein